jgi:hypothetical protein
MTLDDMIHIPSFILPAYDIQEFSPCSVKNFYFSTSSRPAGSFPWVKLPRREAVHTPPTSAKVKKMWIYTSTPPYVFKAECLIS